MTPAARPDGARVVLVVDDDDMVRQLVRTVLEADDFVVVEATNGHEALAAVASEQPAVMVLDVMMPELDGVEVCRRLDHGSIKVLMLTARDDPTTEQASMEAGADAFLAKPFSSIELIQHVERLVGTSP